MRQTIGWLERPLKKIGLDNLGAQQPCVTIYTRLLPGITNVTDRAAYFGFYPWFIRTFETRHPDASEVQFRETLRLADCLMTLVAERHAIATGEDIARHSATCPGRLTLGPVVRELQPGQTAELARYADRSDSNPTRYFKNPLGGLGQYYLGPLRDEYTVLNGDPVCAALVLLDLLEGDPDRFGERLLRHAEGLTGQADPCAHGDVDGVGA